MPDECGSLDYSLATDISKVAKLTYSSKSGYPMITIFSQDSNDAG